MSDTNSNNPLSSTEGTALCATTAVSASVHGTLCSQHSSSIYSIVCYCDSCFTLNVWNIMFTIMYLQKAQLHCVPLRLYIPNRHINGLFNNHAKVGKAWGLKHHMLRCIGAYLWFTNGHLLLNSMCTLPTSPAHDVLAYA